MTRSVYWWSPTRELRAAVGEAGRHGRAWAHLVRHGGHLANFGDEVSPWLVEELTGLRPVWRPVGRADVICVGSILDAYARSGGTGQVLGSGIREPETAQTEAVDLERVVLVRGSLTRHELAAPEQTPLGDPGLVIPGIASPGLRRRSGVVVVPHFAALGDRSVRDRLGACRGEGWQVVLPNRPPLEVARAISGADLVVTSSLHGLVFADAYGVPGQLVTMVDGAAAEPGFKYEDYASALRAPATPVSLEALLHDPDPGGRIDDLAERTARVSAELPGVVEGIYRAARQIS